MRIVTDNPQSNMEYVMNLAFEKDRKVWIRGWKNGEDCTLVDFMKQILGNVTIDPGDAKKLGTGEAKLFCYGVYAFMNEPEPVLRMYTGTKDFARANGARIDPEKMETPEEQEKENRRAAKAMDNFVTKLGINARKLKDCAQFGFVATSKGKKEIGGFKLLGAYGIDAEVIMLEFTQSAADRMMLHSERIRKRLRMIKEGDGDE